MRLRHSTVSELQTALANLQAAFTEWSKNNATWDKPGDMTSKIVNPNFDNASPSGWSGSTPNMTGSGAHGPANVPEFWNTTFDTYQDIKELPVGVYALTAQTMWRGSWNDMQNGVEPASKMYVKAGDLEAVVPFNYAYGPKNTTSMAGNTEWGVGAGEQSYTDEEAGVTYYIPNDPSCFRLYAEAGLYDTKVLFGVFDGEIRIGVRNPAKAGDADNWSCFDTFKLIFYGNGTEACENYIQKAMENFSEYIIPEGTLYTAAYLTAYQQAYAGEKHASSMEEVKAILGGISTAKADLDKNIELWKEFKAICDKGDAVLVDPKYQRVEDALGDLLDYLMDAEDFFDDLELTNEELEAEIAKVQGMIDDIDEKSKTLLQEGDDITHFIKNPGFDEDKDINSGAAEGWTIDAGTGANITRGPLGQGNKDLMIGALGEMNYCFEAWHRYNWDVWQEITNLPKGIYELQVQGYVRCEVGGYTKGDDLVAPYTSPVYLYMNNAMSQFPSVYSESPEDIGKEMVKVEDWYSETVNDKPYPNSMGGAAQCFGWGMYKTTAYGLIAKEGDTFRIGVKMNGNTDWWCIWDSFELTYHTPDNPDAVKPLLEEAIAKIDLTKPMGKDVYDRAALVVQQANDAIAANDGAAMFAALNATFDLNAAIIESVALFENLVAKAESLNEAVNESENQDAINEANALYSTIMTGCDNHTLTDAEAKDYMEQIDVLFTKLKLPANVNEASDSNPVDVTAVIKSAKFSDVDETTNSSEGWNNPGNLGNDDTQKSVLAMEFWQTGFDMYQTIKGLPEGTYELGVDAWIRNGGNQENYDGWKANPEYSMALLYAVAGDSAAVFTAPIANVLAGAQTEDPGLEGVAEATDINNEEGLVYYIPNSLQGGRDYMDLNPEAYYNKAIVKVNADGILTVGIKKAEQKGNSWVVLDNFKLTYFGKNSSQTVSPDLTGIEAVNGETAKVEYFTLDGRKATKAHKGIMIQKVTLSNGATLIQKIRN